MRPLALFDLDDTLVDRNAAITEWADDFVTAWGLDEKWSTYLVFAEAHRTVPMRDFFEDIRREFDLPEPAERLWEQYRVRMAELARCREGALDGLVRLRDAGWRIGIVTNGMRDSQLGKMRHTGLEPLVDGWCVSEEAGIGKPDPEIFRLAAQRCGHEPGGTGWVVGFNFLLDIAGGQAAGMRTIWLQPGFNPALLGKVRPDIVVDSVANAVDALLTPAE